MKTTKSGEYQPTVRETEFLEHLRESYYLIPREYRKGIAGGGLTILLLTGVISWSAAKGAVETGAAATATASIMKYKATAQKVTKDIEAHQRALTSGQVHGMPSFPRGIILPWYTKQGPIPRGWAICDGTEGTPDLRNRFLRGGSSFADVGTKGGLNTSPSETTGGHTLSISELPSHDHIQTLSGGVGGETGYVHTNGQLWGPKNIAGGKRTEATGGGIAHSHSIPEHDNRPEFETVVFIMKT